ncbi:hypothetical protein Leryth_021772 [Lithospermum erythrorhizon]|nr:hypothetical protein Leryth_021772 [Lithospermum erythrorhizon]
MAGAIVTAIWDKLAECMVSVAAGRIGLPRGLAGEEIRNLSSKLEEIRIVLDDAEKKQFKDCRVKPWLEKLDELSFDMDDLLDEWNTMILKQQIDEGGKKSDGDTPVSKKAKVLTIISAPLSFIDGWGARVNIGSRVEQLNERLDSILNEMSKFNFIKSLVASDLPKLKRDSTASFVDASEIYGRVFDKDVVKTKLLWPQDAELEGNSIQIVAVVGCGGIGKTTLAQLVYNDCEVKGHFRKRAWVCVSDPFDNVKVGKAIIQCLEGMSPDLDELDPLLQKIKELVHGKRFLLVMDDVWTEDFSKWEPFIRSLRHADPGSRLLLTTRSERVARVAGSTYIHNLGILTESDSWLLFSKIAFHDQNVTHDEILKSIGQRILKKCKGLPLAIKTIGSLMRLKDTTREWQEVADSKIWELEVAELDLFPHLYLSYNDLPAAMKHCFTFCTIFPKDTEIEVDELVRLWMAEGCLGSINDADDTEQRGEEYFINMSMRSLFQHFKKDELGDRIISCKMHDIVHDFAQYLTKGKCLVIEEAGREIKVGKAIGSDKIRHLTMLEKEGVSRHISLCIKGKPRGFIAMGPVLRELSTDLLNSLRRVRELTLSNCDLVEVPMEIGNLIHLRYLDLRNNNLLKRLPPTIYNLCNLQTLDISGCDKCLELPPAGIEKLIGLRNLICNSHVKYPEGLTKMTTLKSLGHISIGRDYNKWECLENLNYLRGKLVVTIFGSYVKTIKNAKLGLKMHLQNLSIMLSYGGFSSNEAYAMNTLEPPPCLRQLFIYGYNGPTLPAWITSLKYLKRLTIEACDRLTSLSSLGNMWSLEILIVNRVDGLEFVGNAFLGSGVTSASVPSRTNRFPKLKELIFIDCSNWEEWEDISQKEEENYNLFILAHLQILKIIACPRLKGLPHGLLRKASSLKCITLGFNLHHDMYSPSEVLSRPHDEHWWN